MKTLLLALAVLCLNLANAATQIELRITKEVVSQEDNAVYAAVEILPTDNGTTVLADQNYRLYYDAATLALDIDGSYSKLPAANYGEIEIVEHIEGANGRIGQLAFDQELGFLNFTITLTDNNNGGVALDAQQGWTKVAVLKFTRKNDNNAPIVWSRENVTDKYATAFVELTEWVAPFETKAMDIINYTDAELATEIEAATVISTQIGPNPTTDFVKVKFENEVTTELNVTVISLGGQVVNSTKINAGSIEATIDFSDLPSTVYTLQITDTFGQSVHTEKVVKTDF